LAVNVLFAGIAVADLDRAIEWYERLLGAAPDMTPNETERAWKLTDESWIYVVADPERAGKALVTVMVDDLDERLAALEQRGIEIEEDEQVNERTRKVTFVDPEGNRVAFGQAG
jgi:catechol 2,3-dioxygenase-like lactoylglutathione lyase family enzyme